MIMDEPTASLADKEVDRLFRVIAELKADGVGIIYISHRLDELPKVADRVTALRDGVLVGTRAMADVTRGDLIRMMVGRELSAVFPKTFVEPGEVVLEARSIGCRASGVRACLISRARRRDPRACGPGRGGSNRAGSGALRPYARRLGRAAPAWPAGHDRFTARGSSLGIAYVPEDRRRHGVILEMPVASNATLATLGAVSRFGFLDFRRERARPPGSCEQLGIKTAVLESLPGTSPAATSRRWRSPAGWRRRPRC